MEAFFEAVREGAHTHLEYPINMYIRHDKHLKYTEHSPYIRHAIFTILHYLHVHTSPRWRRTGSSRRTGPGPPCPVFRPCPGPARRICIRVCMFMYKYKIIRGFESRVCNGSISCHIHNSAINIQAYTRINEIFACILHTVYKHRHSIHYTIPAI